MKHIVVSLFIISLLAVGFFALNHLWNWVEINYTTVVKAVISLSIAVFSLTGLMMIFKAGYAKNPSHPDVGKKN